MAKKKKNRAGSKDKEFSNSPFKDLKGLSAFESKPAASSQSHHKKEVESSAIREETVSFADEMDFRGVKPLSEKTLTEKADEADSAKEHVIKAEAASDEDVFIKALGAVDMVFKDDSPQDEDLNRAAPRRMRQVVKGRLKPQAELDLHGLTTDDACRKVGFFLENSIYHGHDVVLIITGKGLHSGGGPVLRHAVEKVLSGLSQLVVEWGVAPQRYGGNGALLVFLRHLKKIKMRLDIYD